MKIMKGWDKRKVREKTHHMMLEDGGQGTREEAQGKSRKDLGKWTYSGERKEIKCTSYLLNDTRLYMHDKSLKGWLNFVKCEDPRQLFS